jgi:hypothetical protein
LNQLQKDSDLQPEVWVANRFNFKEAYDWRGASPTLLTRGFPDVY